MIYFHNKSLKFLLIHFILSSATIKSKNEDVAGTKRNILYYQKSVYWAAVYYKLSIVVLLNVIWLWRLCLDIQSHVWSAEVNEREREHVNDNDMSWVYEHQERDKWEREKKTHKCNKSEKINIFFLYCLCLMFSWLQVVNETGRSFKIRETI